VYIDDTPIQIRELGAGAAAFNAFPQVFDLDRIEVLRGPQGTLFGAGSEGGTVRFITPQPSLTGQSAYARTELSYTQGGDPSYEAGVAYGAPIVDDKIGFRASAWFRRDGGWVNRTDWDHASTEAYPPTAPTPANVTTTESPSSNWQSSSALKAAFSFAPIDGLLITPSIYYQRVFLDDTLAYWDSLSVPSADDYNTGNALNANSTDRFYLPALKIQWTFAGMQLISDTSYFNRNSSAINDYTSFETALWSQTFTGPQFGTRPYLNGPFYPAGYFPASTLQINQQSNLTQELRLQSNDPQGRIDWVLGFYYEHARQTSDELVSDPQLATLIQQLTGAPFAAIFGQPLVNGQYTFVQDPEIAWDEQEALYGQADFNVTHRLTLTAGVRASVTKFEAQARYQGPVVGPPVSDSGSQTQHPVTPKAGVTFHLNQDNMLYATAAKGFRIGGYNPRVGTPCAADPNYAGYHSLYGSDSVWSYEVGAKSDLLDHRLRLDTSVYYIDWSNIQQSIALNSCGFLYTSNLGKARSEGFDLQANLALATGLTAALAVGYDDAQFTQTVKSVPGAPVNLVTSGDHIPGWPWSAAASIQYAFKAFGGRDTYIRGDYQYQSRQSSLVPQNDPANGGFQPWNVFELPQTSLLGMRAGVQFDGYDISLFCNNLTDSHPVLSQSPSIKINPAELVDYQLTTFRPRTYGITAIYRY
ncbi:MAG: TonB-dependent receptor, partial [Steroidobacteraceae bacterium]